MVTTWDQEDTEYDGKILWQAFQRQKPLMQNVQKAKPFLQHIFIEKIVLPINL